MNVTHIVGLHGTGKSTLAMLMVKDLESRGAACAVVDSEAMCCDYDGDPALAVAANSGVNHLFLEWLPQFFDRITPAPGARVIRVFDVPGLFISPATQESVNA
jgi:hypothetical protein